MEKKVFVIDTNVLLTDPRSLWKFSHHDVVIPISVLEELDNFKSELSVRGANARKITRHLDMLCQLGDLKAGIRLEGKALLGGSDVGGGEKAGRLSIHLAREVIPEGLADSHDHRILAVALKLRDAAPSPTTVVLVTSDINLRVKASVYGVASEEYRAARPNFQDPHYQGIKHLTLTQQQAAVFQQAKTLKWSGSLWSNEFVFVSAGESADAEPQKHTCIYRDGAISKVENVPRGVWGISARNPEQYCALSALLDDRIRLVTLTGKAGSGKTLLAMASGLYKTTDEDTYQKLLCSRPIFPMGKDIGYLPGDISDKINPWMQPIYDSLDFLVGGGLKGSAMLASARELFEQNLVGVEPLTYIRGRSLTGHYFVVDEAQNLTVHEIKAILTRAGEGTKIILTGDPEQIDVPYIDSENNGLIYAAEKFKSSPVSAHIHLKKGQRSELAELAAELL